MKNLNEKKRNALKGLSKAISIIALLGKILVYISAPCIILAMIIIPIAFNKIEIKDDSIIIDNDVQFKLIEDDGKTSIQVNDDKIILDDGVDVIEIKQLFQNNTKKSIIIYLEIGLFLSLVVLGLLYMVFTNLKKLFDNIHDNDTPFTLQNVNHIKNIAYFSIALIFVPSLIELVFSFMFKSELNMNLNFVNVLEILIIFSVAIIFEYGYLIQSDSKRKIYGD